MTPGIAWRAEKGVNAGEKNRGHSPGTYSECRELVRGDLGRGLAR